MHESHHPNCGEPARWHKLPALLGGGNQAVTPSCLATCSKIDIDGHLGTLPHRCIYPSRGHSRKEEATMSNRKTPWPPTCCNHFIRFISAFSEKISTPTCAERPGPQVSKHSYDSCIAAEGAKSRIRQYQPLSVTLSGWPAAAAASRASVTAHHVRGNQSSAQIWC